MSEKEGELKKRIFSVLESEYQPIIDAETYQNSFTTQLKSIAEIVSEAKKEFPEKIEGVTVSGDGEEYSRDYYDSDEIDQWFKKWFGAP